LEVERGEMKEELTALSGKICQEELNLEYLTFREENLNLHWLWKRGKNQR
jgi:hypothetical protein